MNIWIDFWAAPDPLFFRPIVRRLSACNHKTLITARTFGETIAIAEQCGFSFKTVGSHGGRTLSSKVMAILGSAYQRVLLMRKEDIDLALSFNSYAQGLAAWWLGIPFFTIMDYEYQPANHLAFRLARKVIVPRGFDQQALRQHGAEPHKVVFFDGLKEHITMADFCPDSDFPAVLEQLGVAPDDILVTMRPPAVGAAYHRFENSFFDDVVLSLSRRSGLKVLLLPRSKSQTDHFRHLHIENLILPTRVFDGPNLIYWSDLVISGGGSINREAVVLGTPVYTVFRGRMAGVDRLMIANGKLGIINSSVELEKLSISKHCKSLFRPIDSQAIGQVIKAILS